MKICLRLTIAFIVVATVSLLVSGGWSLYSLYRVGVLVGDQSETALVKLGEEMIRQTAKATARQVELYLDTHPEVDLNDTAQLEANMDLAEIAVQPVGQTGYTAVFDERGVTHFHDNPEIVGMDMSTLADQLPEFWGIFAASLDGSVSEGYYDWEDADGQIRSKYMSIVPVGDTPLRLAATTYIDEFSYPVAELGSQLADIQKAARLQLILALVGVALLAAAGAFVLGRRLSQPLVQIADAAASFAGGDLRPIRLPTRQDEIGVLAETFNAMTERVHDLLVGLEAHSRDLEHRTVQLEAASHVARVATTILDPDELLQSMVEHIRDGFDFHLVSIFLLDDRREYALLCASTGDMGRQLIADGFKVRVGAKGMVGYVTATGQSRVAQEISEDTASLDHLLLPDTHWEMTFPLRVRGEVIGALDIQSTQVGAFASEDVTGLQTLADQIAVAFDNAQLLQKTQQTVRELETAYGHYTQESWHTFVQSARHPLGYRYRRLGIEPVAKQHPEAREALQQGRPVLTAINPSREDDGPDSPMAESSTEAPSHAWSSQNGHLEGPSQSPRNEAVSALAVPIKLRDQVVGVLNLRFEGEEVSPETVSTVEEASDRLALILESARLFQDTQRRAAREQLTSEVTAHIRETLDVETVLRTAVREIGQALGLKALDVRLGMEPDATDE